MTDSISRVETLPTNHPDAEQVGPHLVVTETEWVPGKHPNSTRSHGGQTEYLERYLKCVVCGEDRLRARDFPDECEGDGR